MIEVDTSEFDAALNEYQKYSKKGTAEILNKVAKDVALLTVRHLPKAEASHITFLPQFSWWPKVITKHLKKQNPKFTKAQAKAYSMALIRKRKRGVGMVKGGYVNLADLIRNSLGNRKGFDKVDGKYVRASEGNQQAKMLVQYSNNHASRLEPTAIKAVNVALGAKAKDMQTYIQRKLQQIANKVQGRK